MKTQASWEFNLFDFQCYISLNHSPEYSPKSQFPKQWKHFKRQSDFNRKEKYFSSVALNNVLNLIAAMCQKYTATRDV